MLKADLHVHSKFSDHPDEWFLQRLGANECYTEPEFIYKQAKEKGMDFVTITDHNDIRGAVYLAEKYDDAIVGVESTVYFPEDGCKVHVLLYGLNQKQFEEINDIRENIYRFRDYIKNENLAYSVAHATYSVNGKLSVSHLERLVLLFDVFESINGGRNKINNNGWIEIIESLNRDVIEKFQAKHNIEPLGPTPWIKGFTGGSDDHGGIFIAQTWTESSANTKEQFIKSIKNKATLGKGRHNDFQSLAFTIYKIAYEFSKRKSGNLSQSIFHKMTQTLFEQKQLSIADRMKLYRLKSSSAKSGHRITKALVNLIENIKNNSDKSLGDKLDVLYDDIAIITDEFFMTLLESLEEDIKSGNIPEIIKNLSASIPGVFLSIPFFTTLSHLYSTREIISEMKENIGARQNRKTKRVLWFSDTLTDTNGVSVTLKKVGWLAHKENYDITLVSSLAPEQLSDDIPPNFINLPYMYSFKLPSYDTYLMKIPSPLASLKILYDYEPDDIILSTPGPVALMGLLAAKLMSTKSIGIYHTDFTLQAASITKDESIGEVFEHYTRWFFKACDEIQVTSEEYIRILEMRGFDKKVMTVFDHGIDAELFRKKPLTDEAAKFIVKKDGIDLLFTGRLSRDKNLDFLLDVYKRIIDNYRPDINLLFVGDGPYLEEFEEKARHFDRVKCTGGLNREMLPELYANSDIFVFPSNTDTFGMVVLEAQACETPVIVSDIGGPQRIAHHQKTGLIAKADDIDDWYEKIIKIIEMKENQPEEFETMKKLSRKLAIERYDWRKVMDDIVKP
ncbi:MAG: glycosyltransferase [Candidatus Zixiibacteriota bacterium]